MQMLQETIRPSTDLRNHYSEISRHCRENKEAVIITVNGRGDTVSLAYEEYKRMKARIKYCEQIWQILNYARLSYILQTFIK